MLYYIVPPIIIVLSLAFLISFLFRKFSAVGHESAELLENLNGMGTPRTGSMIWSFFSQLWLRILERMTQYMKLFSLKMHNASNSWFHSVRSKREKINLAEAEIEQVSDHAKPVSAPEEAVSVVSKPRIENFSIRQRIVRKRFAPVKLVKKEEPAKPEPMEKNRLEDALIKRIAVNPKDIEAYERLGDYYSDVKNFKDAAECYKQVAKLSPRNFKAKSKLRSLERILKM